eukprot:gene13546-28732_t
MPKNSDIIKTVVCACVTASARQLKTNIEKPSVIVSQCLSAVADLGMYGFLHLLHSKNIDATAKFAKKSQRNAVVTLLMKPSSGFISGALTLAQSLIEVKSTLTRVIMVTPDVDENTRIFLKNLYDEVVEVKIINCIYKTSEIADTMFDMKGEKWTGIKNNWAPTCTKLAVWNLTQYDRVIFMDSDMIAISPIDDVLQFSTAPFLAAPEILPPDNINSGFMVLEPSKKTFQKLIDLNEGMGVAWTGDQYLINYGLCPNWHT